MRPPAFLVAFLVLCIGSAVLSAWRSAPSSGPRPVAATAACADECGCPPRPVTDGCCCEDPLATAANSAVRAPRVAGPEQALAPELRRGPPTGTRILPWSCAQRPTAPAVAASGSGPAPFSNRIATAAPLPREENLLPAPAGNPPFDLRLEPDTPPPRRG